jgi:hypothetical protein
MRIPHPTAESAAGGDRRTARHANPSAGTDLAAALQSPGIDQPTEVSMPITRTIVAITLIASAAAAQPSAPPPQGPRHGPPRIALQACEGLVEGDACTFNGRYGERVAGSCAAFGDQIACLPPDAPPPPAPGEE